MTNANFEKLRDIDKTLWISVVEWSGKDAEILFWWEDSGTYYVVTRNHRALRFLRCFKFSQDDDWRVSVDKEMV